MSVERAVGEELRGTADDERGSPREPGDERSPRRGLRLRTATTSERGNRPVQSRSNGKEHVLFADHRGVVVGAAHAGWRGALAGVTDATIEAMEELGSRRENIHAAVGPCIAQPSYEVDEAFRGRFVDHDPENARFFVAGPADTPHFDLEAYVVHRLIAAGIGEVEALNLDTYADPDRFYSYRRATHRGEEDYGRQLSAIAIPG